MSLMLSNTRSRKGSRGRGFITAQYLGAKPGLSFDCKPAIQSCLDKMRDEGGGIVYVEPGGYRLATGLTVYRNTWLVGIPGAGLYIDHATADTITFEALYTGNKSVVRGLGFDALQANSGRVFYNPSSGFGAGRVIEIDDCSVNEISTGNLIGQMIVLDDNSDMSVKNCRLFAKGSGVFSQVVSQTHASSVLRMTGNKLTTPSVYLSTVLTSGGGHGFLHNNTFDVAGTSGVVNCVQLSSVDTPYEISNNIFVGTSNDIALKWAAGSAPIASGNFYKTLIPFDPTSGLMGFRGRLDLSPHQADIATGTTYTINNGYAAVSLSLTNTGNPTITMPTGFYPGQTLDLELTNNSGSTIGGYFFTGLSGFAPTSIANGTTYSIRVVYGSKTGTASYGWMLVGAPSAAFTA